MSGELLLPIPGAATVSESLAVGAAGAGHSTVLTGGAAHAAHRPVLSAPLKLSSVDGTLAPTALAGALEQRAPVSEAGRSVASRMLDSLTSHTLSDPRRRCYFRSRRAAPDAVRTVSDLGDDLVAVDTVRVRGGHSPHVYSPLAIPPAHWLASLPRSGVAVGEPHRGGVGALAVGVVRARDRHPDVWV